MVKIKTPKITLHAALTTLCVLFLVIVLTACIKVKSMVPDQLSVKGVALAATDYAVAPSDSTLSPVAAGPKDDTSRSASSTTAHGDQNNSVNVQSDGQSSTAEQKESFAINEQFNTNTLDTGLWEAKAYPKAFRNNEEQDYVPGQVKVADGTLQITAQRDSQGSWHSGVVESKWQYTYGEFEVRFKLSASGQAVWPAAWLMGRGDAWPENGEIDIVENINNQPTVYGNIHGGGPMYHWASQKSFNTVDITQYNTFKVVKQPDRLNWYINGTYGGSWDPTSMPAGGTWPFETHQYYALLNLAIGGVWTGPSNNSTPNTIIMYIDYFTVKNASN